MGCRSRPLVVLAFSALVITSCTGRADGDGASPSETSPVETSADPEGDSAALDAELDIQDLRVMKQPVEVDPDAEEHCVAFGYPCSWEEATPGTAERNVELLTAALELFEPGEVVTPHEELLRIEEMLLRTDDVVSLTWDYAMATSLEFRVEGGVPAMVLTDAASPRSLTVPAGASPQPFRAASAGFDVTPEPGDTSRTAIVFNPYASVDGEDEGSAVERIFAAHPEFQVSHVRDGAADAAALRNWANADAVHLVSHGSTSCPGGDPTSPRCQSGFGLGPIAAGATLPAGVLQMTSRSDGQLRAYVTDGFFAVGFGDTVAMLNACQTAGWRVRGATTPLIGRFKAGLGWNQNVYASHAADAATRFWELAVTHGLDVEFAYDKLVEERLDRGDVRPDLIADLQGELALDLPVVGVVEIYDIKPQARLVLGGDRVRVRDVVTSFVEGDEVLAGTTIATTGRVEDGAENTIDRLEFEVEAIPDGDKGPVRVRVLVDGKQVRPDFDLTNGTPTAGEGWNDWRVRAEDVMLPFDLTRQDVDPERPTPHTWEVRVSDDGFATYSAHIADPVFFGGDVSATGPLPTFTALESEVPPGGVLNGNELEIRFNTAGGQSAGDLLATVTAGGVTVLTWSMELEGTFDTESSIVSGVVEAKGQFPFGNGDQATGEFEATVDFANARVEGVLNFPGYQEPFVATIRY